MKELDHGYIAKLVVLAQSGDTDAFAQLYALTYNKIYNYARRYLRDDYLAQDAVSEVYISVLKKIGMIKDPTLFVAWLNQIAFHTCYDMSVKENSGSLQPLDDVLSEILPDERVNPEEEIVSKDEKLRLKEAVDKLPFDMRQCIVMKYYNNMKIDDIAAATGVSRSTVKRYIASGEALLRQYMR